MNNFFESNLFQTIITMFVGTFAIILYIKQKRDYKKDAAKIILIEIQNTEMMIDKVKDGLRQGKLSIDSIIMPSDSWTIYKHLFSTDFDRDEWDAISNFYNKSKLLDESIKYNDSAFANDVEQIRANKQRGLAEFAKELIKDVGDAKNDVKTLVEQFDKKVKLFDKLYMDKQVEFAYSPQKPINDAKIYLEGLMSLTISTVGLKLKKLSK